jgi:queuine tRNA-ribosyltransferase
MPVATQLSVKTLTPEEVLSTGSSVVITNGFLSSLEPGTEIIEARGGMHALMGFKGGIFSDSGGFQFIRRGFNARATGNGIKLRSPYSGEEVLLTPETVVGFHFRHGVDVGMVLDHCPPFTATPDEVIDSVGYTMEWARRSKTTYLSLKEGPKGPDKGPGTLLYAITQGGTSLELRRECTRALVDLDFDGYGIGGLSIGEGKEETFKALTASTGLLPEDRPRYFMGVGEPDDMIRSVLAGVDIFDSVFPTRNARHRTVFTVKGRENIRGPAWKGSSAPIMDDCPCPACKGQTRGFIHHLFRTGEPLGPRLATVHNLTYIQRFMGRLRDRAADGSLDLSTRAVDLMSD